MTLIRPATIRDAVYVGLRLRAEDEREVQTARGAPGRWVVPTAFRMSRETYAVEHAGNPCAIYGVVDGKNDFGFAWFLATPEILKCSVWFTKQASRICDTLSQQYPNGLLALSDGRNTLHLQWCALMGFRRLDTYTVNGQPFHLIHRCVNH